MLLLGKYMRQIVVIIFTLIGLGTLISHEYSELLVPLSNNSHQTTVSKENSVHISSPTSSNFIEDQDETSHHNHCDNCGDQSSECHLCHYQHGGFIVYQVKFSPYYRDSQFAYFVKNINIKSFITSLLRPPIA